MKVTITQKQADFIENFKNAYSGRHWKEFAMKSISDMGLGSYMKYPDGTETEPNNGFGTGDKEKLWRAVLDGYEVKNNKLVLYKTLQESTFMSPSKKYYYGEVYDTLSKICASKFDELQHKEKIEKLVDKGWTVEELY